MTRAFRIEKYLPLLPPELKVLFDAEIAAGNELNDVEVGFGPDAGKVAVVVNYPFRAKVSPLPAGVMYREMKDRDPMIFEFYMADEKFSLLTGKFKPMKLEKIGPGPESPNEKHHEFMEKRRIELEAEAAARATRDAEAAKAALAPPKRQKKSKSKPAHEPAPPLGVGEISSSLSLCSEGNRVAASRSDAQANLESAGAKFIASMTMTFDMWHDGLGYDLAALDAATPADRAAIESHLINRHPRDWRDIEALARIDTPAARVAVEAGLKSADPQVRRVAMVYAGEKADPNDREKLLLAGLAIDDVFGGLSQAIDEAAEFHPPAVIDALFNGALNRPGQTAVLFAGLLFYVHGKSKEPFDWNHRPFFLRFAAEARAERKAVFRELCEKVGVDSTKYLRAD